MAQEEVSLWGHKGSSVVTPGALVMLTTQYPNLFCYGGDFRLEWPNAHVPVECPDP